ncbi:MAG: hypothetical protein ACOYM3_22250, partial [Terrimicrobiaceae bacterium]
MNNQSAHRAGKEYSLSQNRRAAREPFPQETLSPEKATEKNEQKRQVATEAQEEILRSIATLPMDAALRHTASNAALCAAALRKHGNALPESSIAELNRLLDKRRRAPSVYDFSKNSNTPFDDIARWATTGAIA